MFTFKRGSFYPLESKTGSALELYTQGDDGFSFKDKTLKFSAKISSFKAADEMKIVNRRNARSRLWYGAVPRK